MNRFAFGLPIFLCGMATSLGIHAALDQNWPIVAAMTMAVAGNLMVAFRREVRAVLFRSGAAGG